MHVWVIEIMEYGEWGYTGSTRKTRADARACKNEYWKHQMPGFKFRVRKYVRVDA